MTNPLTASKSLRIAVIGDVHDQWEHDDAIALQRLGVDLALFVGDFGNEAVEVVREIAALPLPKATILGNHDAWYTATPWGQRKCPYDRAQENRVQQQLDLLGETHVGYGKLELPQFGLTVIGGRPFSWGGDDWKNAAFYRDLYGVHNFTDSVNRIKSCVSTAEHNTLIFIGHCGPAGLGDRPESLCGRDWQPIGGDFGDPDLAAAIAYAQTQGKTVPLVAFGHMHHSLRHRKDIQRERVLANNQMTVFLNAACVPRIVTTEQGTRRNFSLVTLKGDLLLEAALVWVDQTGTLLSQENLFQLPQLELQASG
jgi:uncharacterized protein (TIGR04168 family)